MLIQINSTDTVVNSSSWMPPRRRKRRVIGS